MMEKRNHDLQDEIEMVMIYQIQDEINDERKNDREFECMDLFKYERV